MPRSKAMSDAGGYLTEESVQRIIANCKEGKDKLIVKTLAETGRRVSEVVGAYGIRKVDLDLNGERISFIILKKGGDKKDRQWKHVPKWLIEELLTYCNVKSPENIPIGNGEMLPEEQAPIFNVSRQYAFKVVRDASLKANVTTISGKSVHPHHFRHSFVARRMEKGSSMTLEELFLLRDYLEHSDIKITQGYSHINPEREKILFEDKKDTKVQ